MAAVRDFLVDNDGDLAVIGGDFATVAGADAVPQGMRIRMQSFLGDYYLDESIGVPWREQILVRNPDPVVVRELLREAIVDTPDVTDAVGGQLLLGPGRTASIAFTVADAYGSSQVVNVGTDGTVEVIR